MVQLTNTAPRSNLFDHLLLKVGIVIFVHFKKILLISKYFIMFKMRYQKYGFSACISTQALQMVGQATLKRLCVLNCDRSPN